jgi:hypothetical protein
LSGISTGQEAGTVITYKGHGKGDVKKTKVARDTEKEVTVRYKKVHLKWKPWNDDDFQ